METEGLNILIRTAGALALILGMLLAILYFLRHWGKTLDRHGDRENLIRVLATRMVLPKKYVSVIRIGPKTLVVGISEHDISLLDTYMENDTGKENHQERKT